MRINTSEHPEGYKGVYPESHPCNNGFIMYITKAQNTITIILFV